MFLQRLTCGTDPQAVRHGGLSQEYVHIVSKLSFTHTAGSDTLPIWQRRHSLLWALFRVSLVSWELKVPLGPWDLQDQLVYQGKKDGEVRMDSPGLLEKKVTR